MQHEISEHVSELEAKIEELHAHVDTTFDTREAEANFAELLKELRNHHAKLKDTLKTLEKTKETLKQELSARIQEEQRLQEQNSGLESEKREIEETVAGNTQRIETINIEKEKLRTLIGNLKITIDEMKGRVREIAS